MIFKRKKSLVVTSMLLAAASGSFFLSGCGDDDDDENSSSMTSILTLSFTNLPPLAGGAHYEGWAIVDGSPVATGKFNISDGNIVDLDGTIIGDGKFFVASDISSASKVVISIEPNGDTDTIPAKTHIVSGDVSSSTAALTVDHGDALGSNFTDAEGQYLLKTPTDDDANGGPGAVDSDNELSGVWFINALPPAAGLTLPTLPEGWKYEGWAVTPGDNGGPLSTGTFTSASGADDASLYSEGGPAYPGEDFLSDAPEGFTFPVNLRGGKVVVSIEPDPDDSPAPFAFKPLVGDVPTDAVSPTVYDLANEAASNTTNVTGSATIN